MQDAVYQILSDWPRFVEDTLYDKKNNLAFFRNTVLFILLFGNESRLLQIRRVTEYTTVNIA